MRTMFAPQINFRAEGTHYLFTIHFSLFTKKAPRVVFWVLKDSKKANMDLFPYRLFSIMLPLLVVSKCALTGKKKASLV